MRIVITGATGFIGSALSQALVDRGDEVVPARRGQGEGLRWTVRDGFVRGALDGIDAVVHLAAENLAAKRWNATQKAKIRDSRIEGTRRVVEAIAAASPAPPVLVSASAVGIYGDRDDAILDEGAAPGKGFLAEVARAWEDEALAARRLGTRVVLMRTGVVLGSGGGAIPRLKLPFSLGFGGRLGAGYQYMSWIHLDDLVRAVLRFLDDGRLAGPINCTAPEPVTNRVFTRALGHVMHRPTPFPAPRPALRLALGELAEETLLASQRAVPRVLTEAGFTWRFAELEPALADALAS